MLAGKGFSVTVGFHLRQADFVTTVRGSYQNAWGIKLMAYVIIGNGGKQRCIRCFGEET